MKSKNEKRGEKSFLQDKGRIYTYSNLSASIGSNREAFMAGYKPEKSPTIIQIEIPNNVHNQGIIKLPFKNKTENKFPQITANKIPSTPPS